MWPCVKAVTADKKQLDTETDNDGPSVGLLGVPKGALTCDYYKCKAMPERFNHPGRPGLYLLLGYLYRRKTRGPYVEFSSILIHQNAR